MGFQLPNLPTSTGEWIPDSWNHQPVFLRKQFQRFFRILSAQIRLSEGGSHSAVEVAVKALCHPERSRCFWKMQYGSWIWAFPENRGSPKWMVYDGKPFKIDDLGVPLFSETSILFNSIPWFIGCLEFLSQVMKFEVKDPGRWTNNDFMLFIAQRWTHANSSWTHERPQSPDGFFHTPILCRNLVLANSFLFELKNLTFSLPYRW